MKNGERYEDKKKMLLKSKSKEKGITLIALVITIVILIILATVTISIVFGEGGLIDRAQEAKELTEQATREEQGKLNSLMSEVTNILAEEENPSEAYVPVTGIEINPNRIEKVYDGSVISVNKSDIEVTIEPSNATNKNYKWYDEQGEEIIGETMSSGDSRVSEQVITVVSEDNPEIKAELVLVIKTPGIEL